MGWAEFRSIINWLPPTGESAVWRSRKPRSWWVTPEMQFLTMSIHVLELANWQRGGGRKGGGPKPKPIKLPEDKDISVKSADELKSKRQAQAAHLRKRREQRKKERR